MPWNFVCVQWLSDILLCQFCARQKLPFKKTNLISSTLWHLFSWGQILLPLGGAQFLISESLPLMTTCWFTHFLSGFESHFFCSCQSNHLFSCSQSFPSFAIDKQPSSFSLPLNLPCLYSIKTQWAISLSLLPALTRQLGPISLSLHDVLRCWETATKAASYK